LRRRKMIKCKQCGHDCHCDPDSCKDGCICVDCNCKKNKQEQPVKKTIWKKFVDWLFAWQK
jgi:hypothetical protein